MDVIDQSVSIFAATKGFFDSVPVNKIRQVESDLLALLNTRHADIMNAMRAEKQMSPENEAKVVDIIKNFMASYKA